MTADASANVRTVYLVQKIHWVYDDDYYNPEFAEPVRAYAAESDAARVCHEFDRAERAGWAGHLPYSIGGYYRMSDLPLETFLSELQRMNLPTPELYEWSGAPGRPMPDLGEEWWRKTWAKLTPDQHDWFWGLFTRVRFYEVVPVEVVS